MDVLKNYEPTAHNVWQGRDDNGPCGRFFQHLSLYDLRHNCDIVAQPAFIGFCSDEGIRRNLGRPGAQLGPLALRQQLAKLPCHCATQFSDLGDVICYQDLESAQQQLAKIVSFVQQKNV